MKKEKDLIGAARSLLEDKNLILTILNIQDSLVVALDVLGKLVLFNKKCETLTGYSANEVLGEIFWDIFLLNDEKKELKKMDSFIHFALAAADMAMEDSGLEITDENAERVGVQVGAGLGGLPAIEKYHGTLLEKGYKRVSPFFIPMVIINLAPGMISIKHGA